MKSFLRNIQNTIPRSYINASACFVLSLSILSSTLLSRPTFASSDESANQNPFGTDRLFASIDDLAKLWEQSATSVSGATAAGKTFTDLDIYTTAFDDIGTFQKSMTLEELSEAHLNLMAQALGEGEDSSKLSKEDIMKLLGNGLSEDEAQALANNEAFQEAFTKYQEQKSEGKDDSFLGLSSIFSDSSGLDTLLSSAREVLGSNHPVIADSSSPLHSGDGFDSFVPSGSSSGNNSNNSSDNISLDNGGSSDSSPLFANLGLGNSDSSGNVSRGSASEVASRTQYVDERDIPKFNNSDEYQSASIRNLDGAYGQSPGPSPGPINIGEEERPLTNVERDAAAAASAHQAGTSGDSSHTSDGSGSSNAQGSSGYSMKNSGAKDSSGASSNKTTSGDSTDSSATPESFKAVEKASPAPLATSTNRQTASVSSGGAGLSETQKAAGCSILISGCYGESTVPQTAVEAFKSNIEYAAKQSGVDTSNSEFQTTLAKQTSAYVDKYQAANEIGTSATNQSVTNPNLTVSGENQPSKSSGTSAVAAAELTPCTAQEIDNFRNSINRETVGEACKAKFVDGKLVTNCDGDNLAKNTDASIDGLVQAAPELCKLVKAKVMNTDEVIKGFAEATAKSNIAPKDFVSQEAQKFADKNSGKSATIAAAPDADHSTPAPEGEPVRAMDGDLRAQQAQAQVASDVALTPAEKNSSTPEGCVAQIVDNVYSVENFKKMMGKHREFSREQIGIPSEEQMKKRGGMAAMEKRVSTLRERLLPDVKESLKTFDKPEILCKHKAVIAELLGADPSPNLLSKLSDADRKEVLKGVSWFHGIAFAGLTEQLNIFDRKTGACKEPNNPDKSLAYVPHDKFSRVTGGNPDKAFLMALHISSFANEKIVKNIESNGAAYLSEYEADYRSNETAAKASDCVKHLSETPKSAALARVGMATAKQMLAGWGKSFSEKLIGSRRTSSESASTRAHTAAKK